MEMGLHLKSLTFLLSSGTPALRPLLRPVKFCGNEPVSGRLLHYEYEQFYFAKRKLQLVPAATILIALAMSIAVYAQTLPL